MTQINNDYNPISRIYGTTPYVSDSDYEEKRISSSYVANLFELGFSEREIEKKLLQRYDIDEFEDSDIFSEVQKEVQNLLVMVKKHYSIDSEAQENSAESETSNNPPQQTDITTTPLNAEFDSWNVEDTGNLFSENVTKEDFLFEYDFLMQYNNILNSLGEDGDALQYLNGIQGVGAENFFNVLDTDMDGILNADELASFMSSDGDDSAISVDEFNQVYNEAYDLATQENNEEMTPVEKIKDTIQKVKDKIKSAGSGSGSGGKSSAPVEKKITLEELQKQRQDIITTSDKEIETLNAQLETIISTATIDEELKTSYLSAKEAYDSNQQAISQKDEEIYNFDTQLHNFDVQIASLNAELGALKTDTDDAETNSKNSQRKTEIEQEIKALEQQKADVQTQKEAAQSAKQELENLANDSTNGLKKQMDEAYNAMSAALPLDVKTQIDSIKTQIEQIEANKATKLAEIDAKIEAKKAEDIQDGQKAGEMKGKIASNEIGAMIIETAKKYLGYNEADGSYKLFSTGNYGWCADFVTYVVKEVFGNLGYSKSQLKSLGSDYLGASPYKLRTKNKGHYYKTENIPQSAYESLVGTAFICKGSGASGEHTGLVLSVNPEKGTFTTIEGNSGNQVRTQERRISDMYGFVDFSYLYSA